MYDLKTMQGQIAVEESGAPLRARAQAGCFVCGQNNPHGLRIRFQCEAGGEVTARWTPSSLWEGFDGIVHGNIVTAVLDETMSKAVAGTEAQLLAADGMEHAHAWATFLPFPAAHPCRSIDNRSE